METKITQFEKAMEVKGGGSTHGDCIHDERRMNRHGLRPENGMGIYV